MKETSFTFRRGRGVVWVCDIHNSSKFLNKNESVEAMEEYFQRLHWLGRVAVNAAGGQFVKWTGDGFLGWFPTELHRDLGPRAASVIDIIWQLTLVNNVTGLGIETKPKFRLKHGLTVEHDAYLTMVSDENGQHFDLMGRAVVLAFRLAGMKVNFPSIVTQRELVEAALGEDNSRVRFKKISLSTVERQKYFKGDRWGTTNLYASTERKPRPRSMNSLLRSIQKTIAEAEKTQTTQDETDPIIKRFMEDLLSGPAWTQEVFMNYIIFLREDMLGTLKVVARELDCLTQKPAE